MTHTVVHYLDSNTFGGCEEVVVSLLAGLDKDRWQPILLHHDAPGVARLLDEVREIGISCRTVPAMTGRNRAQTLRSLTRELRGMKPAIFHAHLNWPLSCRYGLAAAWLSRIPAVVATAHLYSPVPDARFGRVKQRIQCAAIDRYIAVSNAVKERFCRDLGVAQSKVSVVYNGIRSKRFDQSADLGIRATLSGATKRAIVFTQARLHSQKGHAYLLQAATMVHDAVFVFAGDGPERGRLEQLARSLGVEDRVRFLGHREDVPRLLASCDVFVLPSLYEGLPLSPLEAMAAGKPVVATAVGGTDEAVIPDTTGLLVPPANAAELATAIRRILGDAKLAARLGAAGRARVTKMFSSEAMVRGVTQVYDDLARLPFSSSRPSTVG